MHTNRTFADSVNLAECKWRCAGKAVIIMCLLMAGAVPTWGATINASSCAQSAVQSAINSASHGDTVAVPPGNCSWSGLTLNKAVHLKGAGIGSTNITLSGNNTINKQSAGVVRVSGFSFSKSGGGTSSKGFSIYGSWRNAEPVVIENNDFSISNSGLFLLSVAGGVIIAKNSFTGDWDDSFIQPKDPADPEGSWSATDSFGNKDTNGKLNHYVEDNTFYGGTNQGIDADDSTRVVYRYNTLTYSSFNTHGYATSSVGVRHFEVYNNTFLYPGGTSQIANQNWVIWIRGGTGVIYNNQIADIAGSYWGNKAELKFTIRGAEDTRPQGACSNVSYPVPRQLGQSHNGSSYITDPIYLWGNTGATAIDAGWNWGNPCGFSWSTFFQWGRDAINTGTPKPGYVAYPFPHPLRSGGGGSPPADTSAPTIPSGLTATATSSTQINLTWSASTDNVGVTGYRLERCQGATCTSFSQIASPASTSYSDSGLSAGTTYRYRVAARDAAGNTSGYSSIVSATTQTAGGDTVAPSIPGSLFATAVSASQINLTWSASSDNIGVTGYRLERCQGSTCTNFVQIATPSSISFSDAGLAEGTTYRYRVRATDAAWNLSAYSNIASATTATAPDTTPPSVPSNLSASAVSASQINITWTASTDSVGVTGYVVQRCQGASCSNFGQIATTTGTSYSDNGLSPSTTYRYRVFARDAAGNNSGYSNVASGTTQAVQSGGPPPLPQGNSGIASAYPLDANIESHPDVILADGFESYSTVSNLTSKWSQVYHSQNTRIATEPANVYSGTKALEFRVPQQSAEVSNELVKSISPTEDVIFVRAYTKYEAGYNVNGGSHDGIVVSSNYSTPGVPANGTNKFLVDVENSRMTSGEIPPGLTHLYVYHPEQRTEWGDHWYPDGRVLPFDAIPGDFGAYFVPRPNFTPELNRWYCYEIMVRANTPGQKDGRVALWIDGVLVADYPNVRLRDVNSLKIDTVKLCLHIASNTIRQNLKWYDNVVIARSYIGPMMVHQSVAPPTNLQTVIR